MPKLPSTAPIARLRGEFACAATEIGFLHAQSASMLRHLRRALLLCSLFYVVFGANDIALLGWKGAWAPVLARLAVPALAFAAIARARRPGAPAHAVCHAASAFSAAWMASFLVIVWHRPHDILLHALSMAIMAMVVHIFLPNRPLHALAIAVGGSLGFVALAWFQGVETARHLASMTMLILVANAFGAIETNRHARLWREQYWTQQVLTNLSIRDPLTGCFNRRHLNASLLDGEIARARRYRQSLSLIMCDLDGFKAINDTHGHHAGDELLRRFGALLQAMTRESIDTVVRYGGEEFLIILPETGLPGARELAERVRAAFAAQRVDCGHVVLGVTASFGVVGTDFARDQNVTPRALTAAADELMYEAKRAGRNRVCARSLAAQAQAQAAGVDSAFA
jgi:diguanylate cyclase (GGDEF)-like protein